MLDRRRPRAAWQAGGSCRLDQLPAIRRCPCPSVATVRTIRSGRRPAQHALQFALDAVRAGLVGLVDDEDIGDLHDAGLDRLDVVAHAGHQHHDRHLRQSRDLDLVLADADGFDRARSRWPAASIRRAMSAVARARPPDGAAGGHRADEDAGVGVVLLHADAVAEDRAAGACGCWGPPRGSRRVFPCLRSAARQRVHQRALARARRAGDADDPAWPGGSVPRSVASACGSRFSMPVARRARARGSPARISRPVVISFSGAAARSPGAGFRWCLRRWCRA